MPWGRWYFYRTNGIWLTSVENARHQTNYLLDMGVDLIKVYLEDGSAWGKSYAVMKMSKCTLAFPISSAERQHLLTFSNLILSSSKPGFLPSFPGGAVVSMTLVRFLRLLSRYGSSLSASTSGADRPLPGAFPSFRQAPGRV